MLKSVAGTRTARRSVVLALFLLAVFLLLLIRIFAIQVFDFEKYQKKVLDQITTESPVRAARGEILDAAGRVLASNRTVYRIAAFPSAIARRADAAEVQNTIAEGLAELAGANVTAILEHLSHTAELERTLLRAADADVARAVLALIAEHDLADLLAVEAESARYYPYGTLASHVLGFTGSDGQGLYGLELQYDTLLAGENGAYVTARDASGNELPDQYEAYRPAVDGCTLYTTIDAFVQASLEEQLEATLVESGAANRVCGIAMDVNTGAILGMATAPAFDLNEPFTLNAESAQKLAAMGLVEGSEEYRAARGQLLLEMWSNKAITEIYMPGSTFKTITCSAVLEEGAVKDLEERFFCGGAMTVADRLIHCHKKGGHGSLTFREGLQNSCNPVMMTVAARLGCNTFYEYVKAFGMLEKTGIDLPGEGNSIFHARSAFTELDLATASFGQNFKVSVIQMITAVCAVANGGKLVTPYVVARAVDAAGNTVYEHEPTVRRTPISEQTSATISGILAGGVAGEGGAKNAYVAGYRVAAKTGTSEKIGDNANARIGSCVGYAPADDPQVAVIIVVDEPTDGSRYGSVVAAPYVANVFENICPYLGIEAVYTEKEEALRTVRVPDCVGKTRAEVSAFLAESGISVSFMGEGDVVNAQSPAADTRILKNGATLVLNTGGETPQTVVPQVIGLTGAAANAALVNAGLNVALAGAADFTKTDKTVASQSVAAGTAVPPGTVIKIGFAYDETEE